MRKALFPVLLLAGCLSEPDQYCPNGPSQRCYPREDRDTDSIVVDSGHSENDAGGSDPPPDAPPDAGPPSITAILTTQGDWFALGYATWKPVSAIEYEGEEDMTLSRKYPDTDTCSVVDDHFECRSSGTY